MGACMNRVCSRSLFSLALLVYTISKVNKISWKIKCVFPQYIYTGNIIALKHNVLKIIKKASRSWLKVSPLSSWNNTFLTASCKVYSINSMLKRGYMLSWDNPHTWTFTSMWTLNSYVYIRFGTIILATSTTKGRLHDFRLLKMKIDGTFFTDIWVHIRIERPS